MAQILLKLCQGHLSDETKWKAPCNHGSKVHHSLVRAISILSLVHFCWWDLVKIRTGHPELLQQKFFFLKWLRSCSNFVRGFSLMKLGEKLHITMGLRCSILWSEPSQKLNLVHFCWWDLVKIWRRHPELLQWKFFFSNVSDLAGTWPGPLCELHMGRRWGPGHFGHQLGTAQELFSKAVLHLSAL